MKRQSAEVWLIAALTFFAWCALLLAVFGIAVSFLSLRTPPWPWTVTAFFVASSGAAFYFLKRNEEKVEDFFAFLESLGFELTRRSRGGFVGKKESIYLRGFFYSLLSGLEFGTGGWFLGPSNLQFYIPCETGLKLNHTITGKNGQWSVGVWGGLLGKLLSWGRADDGEVLRHFLERFCRDIPFMHVSQVLTSRQVLSVAAGPARLVYRRLLRENLPQILTFLERLHKYLGCHARPHPFGTEFDAMPIEERLKVMQRSFVGRPRHLIFRSWWD